MASSYSDHDILPIHTYTRPKGACGCVQPSRAKKAAAGTAKAQLTFTQALDVREDANVKVIRLGENSSLCIPKLKSLSLKNFRASPGPARNF